MSCEYDLIINEYQNTLNKLRRDLHMKRVRMLDGKQDRLAKLVKQRRLIKVLKEQKEDLEPTVSLIYSPQSVLKDTEIKGYIVYLLKLKEYYEHEVKTKREMIQEREEMSKKMVIKLDTMMNEYAKKKRAQPNKPMGFVQLDNTSNRLNQMERRICTVQHENRQIREKILAMRTFQRIFTAIQRDLRAKTELLAAQAQNHLDSVVSTYEDRDALEDKRQHIQDRCSSDLKKAQVNQTALDIINEKVAAFDAMIELQKQERCDYRVALTSDLIERGVTGLEDTLDADEAIHSTIVELSGQEDPEAMQEGFRLAEALSGAEFTYLNALMRHTQHTQGLVEGLRRRRDELLRSLSAEQRKMCWEIAENEKIVDSLTEEAEAAVASQAEAREKLDVLLFKLKSLSVLTGLPPADVLEKTKLKEPRRVSRKSTSRDEDDEETLPEDEDEDERMVLHEVTEAMEEEWYKQDASRVINDSNALEFFETIENNILEYLRILVHLRSQNLPEDDIMMKYAEEMEQNKKPKVDPLDNIVPRELGSNENMLKEHSEVVSDLQDLKSEVLSAISLMESEVSSSEDSSD